MTNAWVTLAGAGRSVRGAAGGPASVGAAAPQASHTRSSEVAAGGLSDHPEKSKNIGNFEGDSLIIRKVGF